MKLVHAMNTLENVQQSLFSGDIEIKLLNELSDNSKKFLRVLERTCYINKSDWRQTENKIKNILKNSKTELQKYKKRCKQIRILMKYCVDIHTGWFEQAIMLSFGQQIYKLQLQSTDELIIFKQEIALEINDLILSNISNLETNNQSLLKIMQIAPEAVEMLQFLDKNQESVILKDLWDRCLKESHVERESTLTDIVKYVFHSCKELWESILVSLKDGSIRLCDIPKKLLDFNDSDILKQLHLLCKDVNQTETLRNKLSNCKKLYECKKGADVMLEFKSKFHLTGSFEDIEKVADIVRS